MCDARASTFAQLILRMARQCISPGVWGACWSCRTNYIFEDEGGEQLFKPRLRAPEKPSFDCWSRTAGLQPLYALEPVSNFLSPPSSLTLCFLLSLHKSPDVSPPPFHGPLPGQGLLIRVSPRPARRPQQLGSSRRWRWQRRRVQAELINAFLFELTCILHVGTLLSRLIDSNCFIG